MGNQLGLRFDDLGKALHERVGNSAVKELAIAPRDGGIGRILN
jgi:hypothetical protein